MRSLVQTIAFASITSLPTRQSIEMSVGLIANRDIILLLLIMYPTIFIINFFLDRV